MKLPRKVKDEEKYRVYYCYSEKENKDSGRYTTLADANDYCSRCPRSYVCWKDFDTREQAIEYLNANKGDIWW